MYEDVITEIEGFLPILAILLILILVTVASAAYNLGKIERRLSEMQKSLDEIKGEREDSAAEKKRDSRE